MAIFDFPLEVLKTYKPELELPEDFNSFWERTLAEVHDYPLEATFESVDYHLQTVDTFDVSFAGYGGQVIKAWLILPRERSGPLPCVVEYLGYGGGRGFPTDWLLYASAGYAHFVMDTRGQGSGWLKGDTPDIPDGATPHAPGFMTLGVLDPKIYYYRRVFSDAVRAVEAARQHEAVDGRRLALTGGSQGGGITLAVAGLLEDISVAMPDVPFLCHYRRATDLIDTHPYGEIVQFCKIHRDKVETVFNTLSYFDGANFASRASAIALFSVALRDEICPPSTVFAAYNHYAGAKDIRVYTYNQHEGGQSFQGLEKLSFLKEHLPL